MFKIGKMPDPLPQPETGHVCAVESIPLCDGCGNEPGYWDIRTTHGPWGNFCNNCAPAYAASPTTGTGRGQLWVVNT